jgi:hypothetical protein
VQATAYSWRGAGSGAVSTRVTTTLAIWRRSASSGGLPYSSAPTAPRTPGQEAAYSTDRTVNASQVSSQTLTACGEGLHALAYEWFDDSV